MRRYSLEAEKEDGVASHDPLKVQKEVGTITG
jgi:hypothetical protein